MNVEYGKSVQLSPLVRRVVAHNPSPFTFMGTNTYIIGAGKEVMVLDPGPLLDAHLAAIEAAVGEARVSHILITHTHSDHSPLAAPLKEKTGAKTYAFGEHGSGRLLNDQNKDGTVKIEEGGDMDFVPDVRVKHLDKIAGDGFTIECVWTPGHTSNHICFGLLEEKALFSGDHIMGWATSVVVPPDGNMREYMESLALLLKRDEKIYYSAHGEVIDKPRALVRGFINHRKQREASIRKCLGEGFSDIAEMVKVIYKNIDKRLHPAAAMSMLAHLQFMEEKGEVRASGNSSLKSKWQISTAT